MPEIFDRVVYFDVTQWSETVVPWFGIVAQVYDAQNVRVLVWNAEAQMTQRFYDAVLTDTPGTLYGWMLYSDYLATLNP